jgi:uncharacterized membrane protein (UPF0127 family)
MIDRRRLATVVFAVVAALVVGAVVVASNPGLLPTGEYDRTTVTAVDAESGEELATVRVRVADTQSKRYTGLSDTESLGANEGMLFVHDTEDEYAYVMREMAFPLDIVFVDANGTVTRIHHAELPPEGTSGSDLTRYPGQGKYILEVPYGYTDEHGIEVGDRLRIPEPWGPVGES